jgi:hypothetical protein
MRQINGYPKPIECINDLQCRRFADFLFPPNLFPYPFPCATPISPRRSFVQNLLLCNVSGIVLAMVSSWSVGTLGH